MRSQLRLRILLPVAVLGLLGIGVGAFAMGGPPGGGAETTAATTTTAPPPPPPPARNALAAWADQADKLCAKASRELRAGGFPTTPEQYVAFLESYIDIYRDFNPALVALGAPTGYETRVKRLWALDAQVTKETGAILEAMRANDSAEALRIIRRAEPLVAEFIKKVGKLGAQRCTEDAFGAADPERGLAGALQEHKVVVVLFYSPGSNYDAIQALEARAGAAAARVGFLAVDVSKDRQVASIAAAFQIRDSPAILVVKKGFRIAVRMSGFTDRETIAQAAANARG